MREGGVIVIVPRRLGRSKKDGVAADKGDYLLRLHTPPLLFLHTSLLLLRELLLQIRYVCIDLRELPRPINDV